eukprot:gnl/MRDRNA2_/MRDRNA2_35766_c0_seq1.p1 gnl/MRDRNA2_/MRDRNA2_35766_c0~~gnl/MRDRNA2_/MRDRNA2_35766_c0_seq1.p1  ORF type:complete len:301 (-),score=40.64 gnl/MRDRNA2_/MRDRNA2_35766_c0_seq1:175-1077(-)
MGNTSCYSCHHDGCCSSHMHPGISEALPSEVKEGNLIVDVSVEDGGNWHCICSNVKGQPLAVLPPSKSKEDRGHDIASFALRLGELKPEIYSLFFVATARAGKTFNGENFTGSVRLDTLPTGSGTTRSALPPNSSPSRSSGNHIWAIRRCSNGTGNAFLLLAIFRGSGSAFIQHGLEVFRGVPFEARWCIETIGQSYHMFDTQLPAVGLETSLPKLIRGLHPPKSHNGDWNHCSQPTCTETPMQIEWIPSHASQRTMLGDLEDDELVIQTPQSSMWGVGARISQSERFLRSKAGGPDEIL